MQSYVIIRAARRRAGLTQAGLAALIGTTQSAVARWESGKVSPTVETLERIVRACGYALGLSLLETNEHDLSLALENLQRTPEQRFERFLSGLRFAKELRNASRRAS